MQVLLLLFVSITAQNACFGEKSVVYGKKFPQTLAKRALLL